jgi:protein-L-isoaspartate(D-aspartate) O-methyltransferase
LRVFIKLHFFSSLEMTKGKLISRADVKKGKLMYHVSMSKSLSPFYKPLLSVAVSFILSVVLCPVNLHAGDRYAALRNDMVERQIMARGVRDRRVIKAMRDIPRHLYVSGFYRSSAYEDHPLPIGEGQTISQPYIVAYMTEALRLEPSDRVLEIGTGSGYQAAVLAEIVDEVYTIEIKEGLARSAEKRLGEMGYENVRVNHADGYFGWEKYAPFDAIIITASPNHIPPPLIKQLKEGGRIIVPLGSTVFYQVLTLGTKKKGELRLRQLMNVAFVPMTGEARK